MAEVQYATNGKGNLGVTLGAIGTGLGAVSAAGGLGGLLGVRPNGQGGDPGDKPVTRYDMEMIRENIELKAAKYTDEKVGVVKEGLAQIAVHNATADGLIEMLRGQVFQLYSLTKLTIPNGNIAPGWGPAFVVPGVPPIPTVQTTPPTVSSNGTAAA